mgnify:CR=1 FL=1
MTQTHPGLGARAACLAMWLAAFLAPAVSAAAADPRVELKNASPQPDFGRLPRFFTSDPDYDAFVNEYFLRHFSVDPRGIYLGGGPILGATDHMWVVEWDCWFFPWIDRGAMGLARQGNNPTDVPLTTLLTATIDKYGYVWGSRLHPEPNNALGGYRPTFGWPWPKYNRNTTVKRPTGWEFNEMADGSRAEWTCRDVVLEPGYVDHCLVGRITGPQPEIVTPAFDVDVFQVPILELDIAYQASPPHDASRFVDALKVYWATGSEEGFAESRSVTAQCCALPPRQFPQDYAPWVSPTAARYPLYFPMYLHREWGRWRRCAAQLRSRVV